MILIISSALVTKAASNSILKSDPSGNYSTYDYR